MALIGEDKFSSGGFPHLHRPIKACRGNVPAIGRPGYPGYYARVALVVYIVPPKLIRIFPAGIPLILSVLVEESYVQLVSGEPLTDTAVGRFVA